ncbi:MAG: prepilin-type N-terminal cleavage/methylation domain-containing protein [Desulfatirhabdiaceae bacterium]
MSWPPLDSENGFTMIEVMIALAIMAIGFLALASMQIAAIKGNAQSIKYSMAVALGENKIETYKNTPYDNIPSGTETENNLGVNTIFTRTTIVEADTPIAGAKTVTVTISWTADRARSVSFRTIISQNGV